MCMYIGKKYRDFASICEAGTKTTDDYKTLAVLIRKPNFRHMILISVYKPPKGKVKTLIDFLKNILATPAIKDKEIWILGDCNVDWLKRDNQDTVRLMAFCKNYGLTQCINNITRPNKKGGSCIDLIMTDSKFVVESGIFDDLISDHYGIYSIRKKKERLMKWFGRLYVIIVILIRIDL